MDGDIEYSGADELLLLIPCLMMENLGPKNVVPSKKLAKRGEDSRSAAGQGLTSAGTQIVNQYY